MSNGRPPYPPRVRARMAELVRSGRSISELARELEPSAYSMRALNPPSKLTLEQWVGRYV